MLYKRMCCRPEADCLSTTWSDGGQTVRLNVTPAEQHLIQGFITVPASNAMCLQQTQSAHSRDDKQSASEAMPQRTNYTRCCQPRRYCSQDVCASYLQSSCCEDHCHQTHVLAATLVASRAQVSAQRLLNSVECILPVCSAAGLQVHGQSRVHECASGRRAWLLHAAKSWQQAAGW